MTKKILFRYINYKRLLKHHLTILKSLQYNSGLFAASRKDSTTGYDKSWLRDNFYECLAFLVLRDDATIQKTYKAILKIFLKHEYKIDHAIAAKPKYRHQYIHARYHPHTFDEFWEEWGNKQNDAIGAILFGIGQLKKRKIKIIENEDERRIVQKLINYLSTLEYWHDKDSGMWEENEEIHASSIGACVAGLRSIKNIDGINVSEQLIEKGEKALRKILPRESDKKFVDLALLSLIWPYNIVTAHEYNVILKNVEYHLVRKQGIIRYKNDIYYNANADKISEEAEWCFGFSWLAIIYQRLGNKKKALFYEKKALSTVNKYGEVPELYLSNSIKYNENTPLGWAESLFVVMVYLINKKKNEKSK